MVKLEGNIIQISSGRATLEDRLKFTSLISDMLKKGNDIISIDLSKTNYLPSELMGLLMWKKKELNVNGKDLKIIKISKPLKKIFDNAMVSDFFNLNDDTAIIEY